MTTILVVAAPPSDAGLVSALGASGLEVSEATALYRAMVADVCETVQHGGGDLLINYPPGEQTAAESDPETELRELLSDALPEPEDARYEVQVGQTYAGRVGNALTHLLEQEGERTVGVVEPTAPFLRREHVGGAAMKLRTSDVVLGPAPDGRVYFAGFSEPIDFEDAYETPSIETLTGRGLTADLDVDFLRMTPLLEEPGDLATATSYLRARLRAGRNVPERTAAVIENAGLVVDADGRVSRRPDDE